MMRTAPVLCVRALAAALLVARAVAAQTPPANPASGFRLPASENAKASSAPAPAPASAPGNGAKSPSASATKSADAKPQESKLQDAKSQDAKKEEGPPVAPSTPEMYDDALSAHAAGDARKAAGLLFAWLHGAPRTAENYEPAEHQLADDLYRLGFTHAALVFEADVARTRARPELLGEALARLELWTRNVPHDEERIEEELLYGSDFGAVEGPARAYVAFHQGALDLRNGNDRWSEARFADVPEGSRYRGSARLLVTALKLQRGGTPGDALADFGAIAADDAAPREVRNDARVEAARLLFEQGDFNAAFAAYQSVDLPELDPGRGQLYLEEAWAQYRKGEGSRAMGLLAALDAPSYRALFLPEKFLLRALIFKDACQWLSAKRAAKGLLRRYQPSLDAIHDRKDLTQEPLLSEAALQKGRGKKAAEFVAQLRKERDLLDRYASGWSQGGLTAELARLYRQELSEAERRRRLELEKGVVRVADELLAAVEQAGLVDYEVGLALYRRGRGAGPISTITFSDDKPGKGEEAYSFDGEYWNDELPALRFALTNRCVEGSAP